ncbi:MAG: oxidoreductase [Alphaproteobacteria bacterium]|nr:oxidoreductase [Alphaproteobacteria bacterium]
MSQSFKALVVEDAGGAHKTSVQELGMDRLPAGEVTVRVAYSTVNYKDGLAVVHRGRIIRSYPMVPGIDFSGTVVDSQSPEFKPGEQVVLNGWGVGERHWGGFAQMARAKAEWLVKLPAGIGLKQAMAIGTAGYTAMLCVMALEDYGIKPGDKEVIVTGAAGGVGSVAVAILARLGHAVAASTGRPEQADYLKSLGARTIVARGDFDKPGKPLDAERWAGGIDSVGSQTLATVLSQVRYGGAVAACGLAGGTNLPATVLPFILRGVGLLGVDSVMCPRPRRQAAWARLAKDLPFDKLDAMTTVHGLDQVPALADAILKGQVRGRAVIDLG